MKKIYDAAVIGAGILGLAHAYHLAKRGLSVVVLERHPRAQGASVRNFGMLWPIGQPSGPLYRMARRSAEIWLEILKASGIWHDRVGSLHLAYHDDEAQVLHEFANDLGDERPRELLTAEAIIASYASVQTKGLRAGLWSPTEMTVDPRQAIAELPNWLQKVHGVDFVFNTPVRSFDVPWIEAAGTEWQARRMFICTGADFRELLPREFADAGLIPCKLQMMRTSPLEKFRLGPMLAAGLTLQHYRSFASCPTLPALRERFARELPEYCRYGIHVMASQNGRGELVIGDSHEYGSDIEPFDKPVIDELILSYLKTFLALRDPPIAARWHGIYVKHPELPYVVARPTPNVTAVTGVGGAGMTLSFGLAEQVVGTSLGEKHD